ncbi:phosphoribosylglycinamide formyltransferase [Cytobacillus suaedae]|nr:phosphoribosylglycinamide formyltransferase [Cytobacillus suaedae]
MKNIAVFASGSGSNFEAIMNSIKNGELDAHVSLVVCDKPGAKVIERAAKYGVDSFVISPKNFESKVAYEREITKKLLEKEIDFIVLAGYMRLIGETLLSQFKGKIVNIHPSLLPSFPGLDAVGQAFRAGVKVTGVTIHYVDEGMDTGPIIEQAVVSITNNETIETLEKKIHEVEHTLYPQTLQTLFLQNK